MEVDRDRDERIAYLYQGSLCLLRFGQPWVLVVVVDSYCQDGILFATVSILSLCWMMGFGKCRRLGV